LAASLDGSALVQRTLPQNSLTFHDYIQLFIKRLLFIATSKDLKRIVKIKGCTRERGSGIKMVVKESTPICKNWKNFLSDQNRDQNKEQLFNLLATYISRIESEIIFVATKNENFVSNKDIINCSDLMPCNHEEADTRIFLHLKNIIEMFKISEIDTDKICICANDTDVVVIAIALFHQLNINELWFEFDVGKDKRWLPIHKYATTLSEEKCNGILFWYAFTGCDTMSSFYGRSKKTAWDVWKVCNDITNVCIRLSKHGQLDVKNEDVKKLERFVVLLYDRTSDVESVNECRQILFAQKGRNIELIPPTEDALYQHIKRAVLQARFIWNTSLQK